jgi:hypothetical protein
MIAAPVFRSHEPGENDNPAFANQIVVEAFAKSAAPQFRDFDAAHGLAIFPANPAHRYHAMHNAMEFEIRIAAGAVVEQQNGAVFRSILFERKNLAPVA